MPEIIKSGIFSPEYGFPVIPTVGLETKCHFCHAVLKTKKEEPLARVAIKVYFKEGITMPGWKIPCPECGRKVFFPVDKDNFSSKIFLLLNGGRTTHLLK